MTILSELSSILGADSVSDDAEVLEQYSRDSSFVQPRRPNCVAFVKNADEVQQVVKYANEHRVPITPRSSAISFYGAGIPGEGGIILDFSKMTKIMEINDRDRFVRIEPGVTWAQLQAELDKVGMFVPAPLQVHPQKSVLTSTMEREPNLIPKYEYNETFLTSEMVMPNADMFWTGSAIGKGHNDGINPEGVIPSTRLFLGAQGTLGVATWATMRAFYKPTISKIYFIACDKIEDVVEPSYQILRVRLGSEYLILNNAQLAAMLAKDAAEYADLRDKLPNYTIAVCLCGLSHRPEEKIAYEDEALQEIASRVQFDLLNTVAAIPDLQGHFEQIMRQPWSGQGTYWKFIAKGGRHDIFFQTTLDKVSEFTKAVSEVATKYRYPLSDMSIYIQPKEAGRVCYCEYGFSCDPDNEDECDRIKGLYMEASERVFNMGGLFSNPYGAWSEMVYSHATAYVSTLKTVKQIFDPNNILNPGKLCF